MSSRTSRRSIRGVSCDSLMGWWVITSRREPCLEGGRIRVSGRWDHPSHFWGEAGCASRYLGYRRHVASDTRPGWLVNSLGSGGGFFPRSWTRVLDFSRLEGVGTRHLMVVRDQGPLVLLFLRAFPQFPGQVVPGYDTPEHLGRFLPGSCPQTKALALRKQCSCRPRTRHFSSSLRLGISGTFGADRRV